jgi:hypothetical protein
MAKQIRRDAFDTNGVAHQSPGLWTHPRDRADRYNSLDYWVELSGIPSLRLFPVTGSGATRSTT